jgi:hypothetical protein
MLRVRLLKTSMPASGSHGTMGIPLTLGPPLRKRHCLFQGIIVPCHPSTFLVCYFSFSFGLPLLSSNADI